MDLNNGSDPSNAVHDAFSGLSETVILDNTLSNQDGSVNLPLEQYKSIPVDSGYIKSTSVHLGLDSQDMRQDLRHDKLDEIPLERNTTNNKKGCVIRSDLKTRIKTNDVMVDSCRLDPYRLGRILELNSQFLQAESIYQVYRDGS